ncbi:MAG: hypothetical protein M0R80_10010 [Proteobacteria bacterium]|jgi:hypothetical protein|nr:hypothetical protein [Pseudomonadota bacterium]
MKLFNQTVGNSKNVIVDNATYMKLEFRDFGYQENVGKYKACIGNPNFSDDLSGWVATGSANVTVNSTTREADENNFGSYALEANITVSDSTDSTLKFTYNTAHRLSYPVTAQTGIKFGSSPLGTSYLTIETISYHLGQRWVYTSDILTGTTWKYPNLKSPFLDETYVGVDENETVILTILNLPTGTYTIRIAGVMLYGVGKTYFEILDDGSDISGINLTSGEDVPVKLYIDSSIVAKISDVTYDNLNANGDVGTGSDQVAVGNHTHPLVTWGGALSADPASPADGTMYWNTTTPAMRFYVNSSVGWKTITT